MRCESSGQIGGYTGFRDDMQGVKKMNETMHHGKSSGEFVPLYVGTDYFYFYHEPCKDKEHKGCCEIYAILIDNSCRVIFNLQCMDCKERDALKTAHPLWMGLRNYSIFHISPNLIDRVEKHAWDDD